MRLQHLFLASCISSALLMAAHPAFAQRSKPTESELDSVAPQFQDLVHGRSDKINQNVGPGARAPGAAGPGGPGGPGGPPGFGGGPKQAAVNPSKDPHDLRGYWAQGGGPGGPGGPAPGGGPNSAKVDPRPGATAKSDIDGNRLCVVSLGVNIAPMKVYQSDKQLTFVYGNELRARRIYFGDKHAANVKRSYNGDSLAHWEGDTLVVDTIGIKGVITMFNFDLELGVHDFLLANPTLHVIERITKSSDGQTLTIESKWLDSASKNNGYTKTTTLSYANDTPSYDSECEDVGDHFGPSYGGGFAGKIQTGSN
jgi:hypothetical protein